MPTYDEDVENDLGNLCFHVGLDLHNFASESGRATLESNNDDLDLSLGDLDGIGRSYNSEKD